MIGLLYRIFANFATLRDYELLRGFLLGDVREVDVVFVRELENPSILSSSFSIDSDSEVGLTRQTFAGVCSPGPAFNSIDRSLTEPVKGIRTILLERWFRLGKVR